MPLLWRGLVVLLRGSVHYSPGREQLRVNHQRGRHPAYASWSEGRGHDHKTVVWRGALGAVQQGTCTAHNGIKTGECFPPPSLPLLYAHGQLQVRRDAGRCTLVNRTGLHLVL